MKDIFQKKIRENKDNIHEVCLFLFIFIIMFSIIIPRKLGDLDEMWNYNVARMMAQGYIPYKDISTITFPLVPAIVSIFIKFTADELIVCRLLGVLLSTSILFSVYKITKILVKEDLLSILFTIFIGYICKDFFWMDYNWFIVLITLIVLYIELKRKDKTRNLKLDFLCGILAGLAICSKQSLGITLSFIIMIQKIINIKNEKIMKDKIKPILFVIIGILIPLVFLCIYLICTKSITDFVDYAIIGIKTFSNNTMPYKWLISKGKLLIKILAICFPIVFLIMAILLIYKKKKRKDIKTLVTLFLYDFAIIIVMYPISDESHFLISSIVPLINAFYLIYLIRNKIACNIKSKKIIMINKFITITLTVGLMQICLIKGILAINKYKNVEKNYEINHFFGIEIVETISKRIKMVDDYILRKKEEGKKVYILDSEAAIYKIPLNMYEKNYDMLLNGNLGSRGVDGIIEDIRDMIDKEEKNIFLIKDSKYSINYQIPKNVLNYVRKSLEKVDQITIYDVYE